MPRSVCVPPALQAFVDNFWLMGVTFLCMIPLMILMQKAKPHVSP